MKKILIIENLPNEIEFFKKLFLQDSLIDCSTTIDPIYDKALRRFRSVFEYEFVLIHRSFVQEGIKNEIIADLEAFAKKTKTFKLVEYSGGTTVSSVDSKNQIVVTSRSTIRENISNFVSFSKLIDEWYLPALLFKDYKRRFLKKAFSILQSSVDESLIQKALLVMGYENVNADLVSIEQILKTIDTVINE